MGCFLSETRGKGTFLLFYWRFSVTTNYPGIKRPATLEFILLLFIRQDGDPISHFLQVIPGTAPRYIEEMHRSSTASPFLKTRFFQCAAPSADTVFFRLPTVRTRGRHRSLIGRELWLAPYTIKGNYSQVDRTRQFTYFVRNKICEQSNHVKGTPMIEVLRPLNMDY